jgi:hypothetical protein
MQYLSPEDLDVLQKPLKRMREDFASVRRKVSPLCVISGFCIRYSHLPRTLM